jgi:hypothetical protein
MKSSKKETKCPEVKDKDAWKSSMKNIKITDKYQSRKGGDK